MSETTTAPALLSTVTYTDTQGKTKAALVIGTPESTDGRIEEGQVTIMVFSPLNGNSYHRYARFNAEDGTFHNSAEVVQAQPDSDDDQDDDEDDSDALL